MIEIENDVPVPVFRAGRKSAVRDGIVNAIKTMNIGDSFRVEYTVASMRNIFRMFPEHGSFKVAKDQGQYVRVWRVG
jgi:hypothetical protein